MREIVPYIVARAKKANASLEIHSFPSGALMIDISVGLKFYVVQIFDNSVGLSLVTKETAFDTLPDNLFNSEYKFKVAFENIFIN